MELDNIETKITPPIKKGVSLPVVIVLMIAMLGVGFFGGDKIKISKGKLTISKGSPPQNADYSELWETLDLVNSKYVDRPLDQQKLMYGAIAGMVSAVGDPYTLYFDPKQAKAFTDQLRGTFGGIGAEVGAKNDQIIVIAPLDDTPASRAGLLAGDAILAIDGESTSNMAVDQAVSKIRGNPGTDVTLSILHPGKRAAQDIKITRSQIAVKSVKTETKDVNGKKIGVIKISQFGDDTRALFEDAVQQVLSDADKGLIIDLRNDPGGYLDTAVAIASNWVENGQTVVKERNFKGETKDYPASGINRLSGIKTVILVNDGSASASEILSGALQDYGFATLVGDKTFGKGSVQELNNLKDNSEVKITVAKWFTPKDRGIDKIGLEPDIKVAITADDVTAGKDPQMEKALEQFK